MSKEEFTEILDQAFDEGTPFIDFTEYYCFALIPKGGGDWLQVSYDFMEHEILEKKEIGGEEAFNQFCEELEKSLSTVLDVFYLNHWKEFKSTLDGSLTDKLEKSIEELKTNTDHYAENLPVVFSKENIGKVKDRL